MYIACQKCPVLEEQILELSTKLTQEQFKRSQTSKIAELLRDTCMDKIEENEQKITELNETVHTKEETICVLNEKIEELKTSQQQYDEKISLIKENFQQELSQIITQKQEINNDKLMLEDKNTQNFEIIAQLKQQNSDFQEALNTQEVLVKQQQDKIIELTNFITENDIKKELEFKNIIKVKEEDFTLQITNMQAALNQLQMKNMQVQDKYDTSAVLSERQQSNLQVYEKQFEDTNNLLISYETQIRELKQELAYITKSLEIANEKLLSVEQENTQTSMLLQTTQVDQMTLQQSQINSRQIQLEIENEKQQKQELLQANITLSEVLQNKDQLLAKNTLEITKLQTKITQLQRNDIIAQNQTDINRDRLKQYYDNALNKIADGSEFIQKIQSTFDTKLTIIGEELGEFQDLLQIKEFIIYNFNEATSVLVQKILTMDLYCVQTERKGISKINCFPYDRCGGLYELIINLAFLIWIQS